MVFVFMNYNKGFFGCKYEFNFIEEYSWSCLLKELEDKVKLVSWFGEGLNYLFMKIGRSVIGFKYCGRWVIFFFLYFLILIILWCVFLYVVL